jgi:hypothetical protein
MVLRDGKRHGAAGSAKTAARMFWSRQRLCVFPIICDCPGERLDYVRKEDWPGDEVSVIAVRAR